MDDIKKYDGCSGYMSWAWRKVLKRPPPWEFCCDIHDNAYAKGGTYLARLIADIELMQCIRENGYPRMAKLMFYAVRIGGAPWLPVPWRWGFNTSKWKYGKE